MQGNTHKTCIFQKKYTTFVSSKYPSWMKYRFADILIDTSLHCVMRRALFQQKKRVERGWFPKNPKRK